MNRNLTQPILPAALVLLLSAVFLPGRYNGFSAQDAYVADPVTSSVGLQYKDLDTPDGDDLEFSGSSGWLIDLPVPRHTTTSSNPAPVLNIAFTVSQARAPPRF
jgi:hypothetical protein